MMQEFALGLCTGDFSTLRVSLRVSLCNEIEQRSCLRVLL